MSLSCDDGLAPLDVTLDHAESLFARAKPVYLFDQKTFQPLPARGIALPLNLVDKKSNVAIASVAIDVNQGFASALWEFNSPIEPD